MSVHLNVVSLGGTAGTIRTSPETSQGCPSVAPLRWVAERKLPLSKYLLESDIQTLHLKLRLCSEPWFHLFFTAFTPGLKTQHLHQSCRRAYVRGSLETPHWLVPGTWRAKPRHQRGLNQAFVSAVDISALQIQDPTLFPAAAHSSRTEHAGKSVCTTSLCWRQPRLLPVSMQGYFYRHRKRSSPHHPTQQQ